MSVADLTYPHVNYRRTGLRTVVCQVRFNSILRIGQEAPVTFQELVRHEFPKFEREETAGFRLSPAGVEALPPSPSVSNFKTEDDAWKAGLAVDNASLESTRYRDFDEFERRFGTIVGALQSAYGIDHFVRVGLRYINVFLSSDFPGGWVGKFNPELLGVLADGVLGGQVAEYRQAFVFAEDDWTVAVRHGTDNDDYRLDIDHATEARVDAADALERIRDFRQRVYQVFRWAISDTLHEEMEPEP